MIQPRPILRWKSLWFGILILGFIAWAWRRSASHSDELAFTRGTTTFAVESHCSSILFTAFPFHPALPAPGWEFRSEVPWDSDLDYFKPPFIQIHDGRFHYLWLAWWIPALSFLLPWTAFLTWRWRRMKGLATSP
ncbi:MAG: hypothetical protein EOP87_17395 [Verrucomicrobiaceae bacterium]|nr:MAG: hypothetical protein EOP87_17395 [Verrucomicrobiaceae bacterium]